MRERERARKRERDKRERDKRERDKREREREGKRGIRDIREYLILYKEKIQNRIKN